MDNKSYIQPVPSGKVTPITSHLVIMGITTYVISFALPAVSNRYGWEFGFMCAFDALWPFREPDASALTIFGGLINPMIAIYLFFRHFDVVEAERKKMAMAILVCIALTWVALVKMELTVLIGHICWVVGILLILSPAIADMFRRRGVPS